LLGGPGATRRSFSHGGGSCRASRANAHRTLRAAHRGAAYGSPEQPNYVDLDPTTGLHMTGGVQVVELEAYRLEVTGKVGRPLSLTYDELRCIGPKIEMECTLVCPGFFTDIATWAGAPLNKVLELAQVQPGATGIKLFGADGYAVSVPMDAVRDSRNFLAYEWEGEPIPVFHGFPVRAVFPALDGGRWMKWLVKIEVE